MLSTSLLNFTKEQSGAITVEKTVVAAGVIGLVIAVITAISANTKILAKETTGRMRGTHNTSNFESVLSVTPDLQSSVSNYYTNKPIDGWTSANGQSIELVTTRDPFVKDKIGHAMIDLENDRQNSGISKTFEFLEPNKETLVTITAVDIRGGNGFDVMQNGQVVGTVSNIPSTEHTYVFDFVTGSDPQTEVSIVPHGRDHYGAYVGTVKVTQ